MVETQPRFFFEGAWAGDFAAGRPDATEVAFGTGCVALDDGVCFVSSLATTDYLLYRALDGTVVVSNSLPLLLASISDSLDPAVRRYDAINNTILTGVMAYEREIPTRGGRVRRLMHNNLLCSTHDLREVPKPESPHFTTFAEYRQYLTTSYDLLARNARDPRRARPLRIYSTQSRGYDSTAVNALASSCGVDGVFTITRGKGNPGEPDVDDDGTEIARTLGLANVVPIDRHAYRDGFADELYYHASMHECQDANLKQVTEHLEPPALLLTGTLGEIWYTRRCWYVDHPDTLHSGLARGDLGTHGLTEVRLRAGYVQVAIPYIGGRRREEILRISESDEMRPWRLENSYDRPIARRLGEEAGVSRAAFGQKKTGSVVEWPPPQEPRNLSLRRQFRRFVAEAGLRPRWQIPLLTAVQRINGAVATTWWKHYRVVYYPVRDVSRLLGRDEKPPVLWRDLRGSLFCFAVNECVKEYASALGAAPEHDLRQNASRTGP
jgi:hypothetical protein